MKKEIMGMPSFVINHFNLIKTNAYKTGKLIHQKFPLILYSHGAGSIMVDNTALLEEIASQGYVVMPLLKSKAYNVKKGLQLKTKIIINFFNQFLKDKKRTQVTDNSIVWIKNS